MKNSILINALQDLIIRLQDAEKGYKEISLATGIRPLKKWLQSYAKERHNMHKMLESQVALLGGNAEVRTSFLGDLHRMFIDIKINNVSFTNEFDAVVEEIERGSSVLIDDYTKIINEVEMPETIRKQLVSQRALIIGEVNQLKFLKEELNAVEAS